jgi:hypothetical protein
VEAMSSSNSHRPNPFHSRVLLSFVEQLMTSGKLPGSNTPSITETTDDKDITTATTSNTQDDADVGGTKLKRIIRRMRIQVSKHISSLTHSF